MRLKNQQMSRKCYDKSKSTLYIHIYNNKLVILQGHNINIG